MNYSDDCTPHFGYLTKERFADIQLLRYRLNGFEQLSLLQKKSIYYLSKATLYGRDITFDQFGKYNLRIRKMLEAVYTDLTIDHDTADFRDYLRGVLQQVEATRLPLRSGETVAQLCDELFPVIFDATVLPKRVNKADGADLIQTSACNFYDGVTQQEAEAFYARRKAEDAGNPAPASYGLNSTLVKEGDVVREDVWKADGRYGNAIRHIVYWLEKAQTVAENPRQQRVIELLIKYYQTGNLQVFNDYCIEWVGEHEGRIDFVNGFIEVYGDPLGLKGSWEGIVEYKDEEATKRTQAISQNAQWFEDHSPVDPRFRKPHVKGVTANAICAAMLGGDEYPSTAIGINLPNADWIRAEHGSKSITISNITDAYNKAAHGNGFKEEFVVDDLTLSFIERYGDMCDDLHTDLHECLGHGSGQLLPGTDPDALKAYGNTIEEARADLFGLYYIADHKLVELGLLPDDEAYKAQYYSYIMNGLMTQLIRIEPGRQIEEAHMRNRALIAHWCYEQGRGVIKMEKREGKTFVIITDYQALRTLFARLLAEIQRIKSEGDFDAARQLVERYAVKVDADLHAEVLERYKKLNLAPYKGFLNPRMLPVMDAAGDICDIQLDYSESYTQQMLRYGQEYGTM